MSQKLPYIFDLLWDVKTYEQVERIAKFEADRSDARPYDLVKLFQQENLEIPECLKGFVQKNDIEENLALICATLIHRHALISIKEKNPAGWNRIGAANFAWWCKDLDDVQEIADKLEDFIARLES